MVAHEMHDTDVLVKLRVQCLQKGHEFSLTLPCVTVPIELARTGARGGKAIESTSALIFVLVSVGNVLRLGWLPNVNQICTLFMMGSTKKPLRPQGYVTGVSV